jgi:hypothetical protein
MRVAVAILMMLLPTSLFGQSESISMKGYAICPFALPIPDGIGGSDWASGYAAVPAQVSCMFGATWTDNRAQSMAWNWVDTVDLDVFGKQSGFVISSSAPDWTNNFGAGYPDLTNVASAFSSLSASASSTLNSSTTGQGSRPK